MAEGFADRMRSRIRKFSIDPIVQQLTRKGNAMRAKNPNGQADTASTKSNFMGNLYALGCSGKVVTGNAASAEDLIP